MKYKLTDKLEKKYWSEAFNSINDAICLVDFKGNILKINQSFCKFINANPSEIIGKKCWELLHNMDNPIEGYPAQKTLLSNKRESMLFKFKENKWYLITVDPLIINGKITGAIHIISDQTNEIKTRTKLDESRTRLKILYDSIPAGVITQDQYGMINSANTIACEILGTSQDKILGMKSEDKSWKMTLEDGTSVPGDQHPAMITFKTGKPIRNAIRAIYSDDSLKKRWLMINTAPIKEPGNEKLTKVMIIFLDITDLKTAIIKKEESIKEFKQLFDNMGDGVAIYRALNNGSDFMFVDINKAGQELSKVKKQEIIGKKLTSVFPKVTELGLLDTLQRVWKSGKAEILPANIYKDERIEQWVENYVFKISNGNVVAIYKDTSKQKKFEEELIQSEHKYKTLVDLTDLIILSSDKAGKIDYVNPKGIEFYNLTPEINNSTELDSIFNTKIAKTLKSKINQSLKYNEIRAIIWEEKRDELTYWFSAKIKPFKLFSMNKPEKILIIIEDITAHKTFEQKLEEEVKRRTKAMEKNALKLQKSQKALTYLMEDVNESWEKMENLNQKLENANKELEAFAYSVSHDLRAPLRHIDGFVKMLESKIKTKLDKISRHYLDNILSASKNMSVLIDELLTFSRMGRIDLDTKKVNMQDIVEEAKNSLHQDYKNRNIKWNINVSVNVKCDPTLFRQVWINLISNAIKFTKSEKTALISIGYALNKEKKHQFYIKDNGVGFDMKYVKKVFGVFQRLHNEEEFPGTGIGLANVKRIIKRHQGEIWAEGKKGKGAVFFFTIN